MTNPPPETGARFKSLALWIALAVSSAALAALLTFVGLPAAILIGPMIVAIVFGIAGAAIRVPRRAFLAAQGIVGCLISASITPEIIAEVARDWHAMLLGAAITIVASAAVGLVLARFGSLPGSTAAWGTSPGLASGMVVMAQEYGADPRLVATMQYVRVITVVIGASLISRALIDGPAAAVVATKPVVPMATVALGLAICLAIIAFAVWLNERVRIPAGGLMVPLALAGVLNAFDILTLSVPSWLAAIAYAVIGWTIGLQFERGSLIRSVRALPEMLGAALATIAACGLGAWLMVWLIGVSPLTAFLATTPGGIDIVVIISLSGGGDTPFVMSLHVVRLLAVILLGPAIARFVARHARPDR